jgi:hypothetical protein
MIDHGRTVAAGSSSELKARIGDQRIDIVATDDAGLDALVGALKPAFDVTVARERRVLSIPAPNGPSDLSAVTTAVQVTKIPVDEVALRRPTLDDAFLSLTGQPTNDAQQLAS